MPRMYYSWICRLEPRAKQGSSSVFRRYTLPLPCKQRPLSRRSQRPPQRRSSLTRACSETDVRANAFWRYKLINKTTTTVAQVKQYFLRVERNWPSCQQLDTTLGDGIPSPLRYTDTSQGLQYPYYRPLFVCFYQCTRYIQFSSTRNPADSKRRNEDMHQNQIPFRLHISTKYFNIETHTFICNLMYNSRTSLDRLQQCLYDAPTHKTTFTFLLPTNDP